MSHYVSGQRNIWLCSLVVCLILAAGAPGQLINAAPADNGPAAGENAGDTGEDTPTDQLLLDKVERERRRRGRALRNRQARILWRQGVEAYRDGQYGRSRQIFDDFRKLYPRHRLNGSLYLYEARAYLKQQEFHPAMLKLLEYYRFNPRSSQAELALYYAGQLCIRTGQYEKAGEILNKLRSDHPASVYLEPLERNLAPFQASGQWIGEKKYPTTEKQFEMPAGANIIILGEEDEPILVNPR